jgi:hypothetical protein
MVHRNDRPVVLLNLLLSQRQIGDEGYIDSFSIMVFSTTAISSLRDNYWTSRRTGKIRQPVPLLFRILRASLSELFLYNACTGKPSHSTPLAFKSIFQNYETAAISRLLSSIIPMGDPAAKEVGF